MSHSDDDVIQFAEAASQWVELALEIAFSVSLLVIPWSHPAQCAETALIAGFLVRTGRRFDVERSAVSTLLGHLRGPAGSAAEAAKRMAGRIPYHIGVLSARSWAIIRGIRNADVRNG